MRASAQRKLRDLALRRLADRPVIRPSDWAVQNAMLSTAEERGCGPVRWHGREFCVAPLNDFADPAVSDVVCCFGSQIGKTVVLMCGVTYLMACDPCGVLWVMPDVEAARSFSLSRWKPFVEGSNGVSALVPRGKLRSRWANLHQQIGGVWVNFVGSNSRSGLAGRPKRVVVLDEMDKFPTETRGGEAGAINLAEQRVKDAAFPKRIKTSTPSTTEGPGWIQFLKGDQRRFLVPCPHCKGMIFLAWLKGKSALRPDPRDAHITWDQGAKRADNTWDLDRVVGSAHCVCPHCSGDIREHHKPSMLAQGEWVPTQSAPSSFHSYHLPSFYALSPSTSLGLCARQWLMDLGSLEGVQGFVNGTLAEPWDSQSEREERTEEIITAATDPIAAGAVRLMSVDVQRNLFYWVVREWDPNTGDSRRVGFGTCDGWSDLDQIQHRFAVDDRHVVVDSGDGVMQADIFRECASRGVKLSRRTGLPLHVGWTPAKGFERERRWLKKRKDGKTQSAPFGTALAELPHAEYEMLVFQFAGPYMHDILHELRGGAHKGHGIKWQVVADPEKDPEYWSQMDSKIKRPTHHTRTGRTTWEWTKRSKSARDHYPDCEIQGLAFALFHRLLPWTADKERAPEA